MDLPIEPLIRITAFTSVILTMSLAESLFPRRRLHISKATRWWNNLGLFALNTFVARLLLPMGAVGVAQLAESYQWGFFNQIDAPNWLAAIVAFILFDLAIYLQHVLFHAIPTLWQLHRVHHADLDFDASTGLRFHPLEIALSLGIKLLVVLFLGAPMWAVLAFELMLNATSLFNHANLRLPTSIDRVLRLFLVTPDMHRVHHSIDESETNSNFGFNLTWWDYVFGTYRAQPKHGHEAMTIGLSDLRDEVRTQRVWWLLALPFLKWFAKPTKTSDKLNA